MNAKALIVRILATLATGLMVVPAPAAAQNMKLDAATIYNCTNPRVLINGRELKPPREATRALEIPGSTLHYRCDKRVRQGRGYVVKVSNRAYQCPAGTTDVAALDPGARAQHDNRFQVRCYGIPPHRSNADLGDTLYSPRVCSPRACSQRLIDKFWRDFDFDRGDWNEGLGYYHVEDIERPLNRTFSALWALLYSTTNPPSSGRDFGGDILRWGYNYAAREIDELDGSMATDALATTKHGCFLFCDNKTVLKRGFFYNLGVPERAGTIVHEARHADGNSHASCRCPRGASCDAEWPANHRNWQRYGSNVYQVLYLWLFADSAVNTTPAMQRRALQRANDVLNGGFCTHPGFNIVTQPQRRVHLRAHNRQYLVAEGGGGGALNANRDYPRDWETFTLVDTNGGALESGDAIHLRTYDGHYVVAENGGGGVVQANRNTPRRWETFVIERADGSGRIQHGDRVTLRAPNRRLLGAEGGGGRGVNAVAIAAGRWERFTILWAGGRDLEVNVDRLGGDYHRLNLPQADPMLCKRTCEADAPLCKAWTYVHPGFQGEHARCWLKRWVPAARSDSCCVSGTVP